MDSNVKIKTPDGVALDAVVVTPARPSGDWVILAHGITVDREEEGTFTQIASQLADAGYASIRFSFRGHGKSTVPSHGMTVSGEMLDLKAVVDELIAKKRNIAAIVAASFGAVSTALLSRYLESRIGGLVLWNPVLSLQDTFINPRTPWAKKNFAGKNVEHVYETGLFKIDNEFQVGTVFWEELQHFKPDDILAKTKTKLLILHGDRDSYVPYQVAQDFAKRRSNTEFVTVPNSDHGFPTARAEKFVIDKSIDFIQRLGRRER